MTANDQAVLRALAENQKALAENQKALADAQTRIDELSARIDDASADAPTDTAEPLKIYGFMDVGLDRVWVPADLPIATVLPSANATSFVVGNLNLYLDAEPTPGWRGLLEVRFTNAPQGEVTNYGGLAGTFTRTSTRQNDPHAATANSNMWGGYTVIERAHIDWTDNELFRVRVGNFFTPFGIWNVDHGTPTLISLALPQMIAFGQFPIRQTGVMLYGSKVSNGWELGYNATLTNGRQELSNFAFDDNRGFGGRVFANREDGELTLKFGVSGYTGRVRDNEVDVTAISPAVKLDSHANYDFRETVVGADVAVDVGRTRIRAEGTVRRVVYDEGKHEPYLWLGAPGATQPNRYSTSAYFLIAHQLPFAGLEPFAIVDSILSPLGLADTVVAPGIGVNIRFNSSVQLKTQANYGFFMNLRDSTKATATVDPTSNNLATLYSRLVLVF